MLSTISFAQFLCLMEKDYPSRAAFVIEHALNRKVITYADLSSLIRRCLWFFQKNHLPKEKPILSLLPNSIEKTILFLASICGGYQFAPLSCNLSLFELEKDLALLSPSHCFCDISLMPVEEFSRIDIVKFDLKLDGSFHWLPSEHADLESDAQAKLFIASSGTTGESKAILIDSNKLWESAIAFSNYYKLNMAEPPLCFWNYLPMSYLGGLFNLCLIPLAAQGSSVIDEPFSGKTFLNFWETVKRLNINVLWFVPTIIQGLLSLYEGRAFNTEYVNNIQFCFLGTAPIHLQTKKQFEEIFSLNLLENYGLTETTFISAELREERENRKEGSVGRVLPYVSVRLQPSAAPGSDCQEIWVRTAFICDGYLCSGGSVEVVTDDEGFMQTGDLGYMNVGGELIITGRNKDIIKKGGQLINLREIELMILDAGMAIEAAAVKIAHDFYGESYVLYIKNEATFNGDQKKSILAWIHEKFSKIRWPEDIFLVDDFPKTKSGKIQKYLLASEKVMV